MGLSLAVLVALVFMLPGAAFIYALQRDATQARQSPLDSQVSETLAKAITVAIVLHAAWYGLWLNVCVWLSVPSPDVEGFFSLLNPDGRSSVVARAIRSIAEFPLRIAAYFASITLVGGALGSAFRLARAHIRGPRDGAVWGRVLAPAGIELVGVTLDVDLNGTTYLFSGFLREYALDRNGELERVVLEATVRRPLSDTPLDSCVSMSGDVVVVRVGSARSIKIDYFQPDDLLPAERGLLGA